MPRRVTTGTNSSGAILASTASVAELRGDLDVLKPAHGFGGQDVVLGWRSDDAGWDAAVRAALAGEQHVVQERVASHRVAYPALEAGLPERQYFEDADPFVLDDAED